MMRWLPLVVAVAAALGCIRLGVWQLDRLGQRRAANALLAVPLADTVTVTGVFDFARDSVLANRAQNGVPGVWILTPLRRSDGIVMQVNRGFTPSPDGRRVDLSAYRESDTATVSGVVLDGVLRRLVLPTGHPEHFYAVPPPVLSDGPHLSYAIQWFAFATIALVGGSVLSVRVGNRQVDPKSVEQHRSGS